MQTLLSALSSPKVSLLRLCLLTSETLSLRQNFPLNHQNEAQQIKKSSHLYAVLHLSFTPGLYAPLSAPDDMMPLLSLKQ